MDMYGHYDDKFLLTDKQHSTHARHVLNAVPNKERERGHASWGLVVEAPHLVPTQFSPNVASRRP